MGFSSQSGHVALRTQAVAGTYQADLGTAGVAVKVKTGALAANRDLMIPDPEIGGGRDQTDAFLGGVTFTGDYEFYVRLNSLLTFLYSGLGIHNVGPAGTRDVQTLGHTGTVTGGTFTLTYAAATTANIPFNATAVQIQTALEALAGIGKYNVVVTGTGTINTSNMTVTFDGALTGAVTAITATSTNLTGTTPIITVTHTTTGASNVAGFTHLFIPTDVSVQPFLSIEEQISNVFDVYQYTDAVVNTLHLECDANGYFMGTAGMIARLQAAQASPTNVTNLFDNSDLLVGTNVTVSFAGTQLAAKSFKFDLDNQVAADDFRLGSFFIGDITSKRRQCTVGVTIREQDKTLWRQATYGNSAATAPGGTVVKDIVTITAATYSTIPSSSPTLASSIQVEIPLCAIKPYALKVSGDDIMDDDIEFECLRPDPGRPLMRIRVVIATGGAPA